MAFDSENKFVQTTITAEVSQWHTIKAKLKAQKFPGSPLLDTNVDLEIPTFCITWNASEKFMEELAELIRKYQI